MLPTKTLSPITRYKNEKYLHNNDFNCINSHSEEFAFLPFNINRSSRIIDSTSIPLNNKKIRNFFHREYCNNNFDAPSKKCYRKPMVKNVKVFLQYKYNHYKEHYGEFPEEDHYDFAIRPQYTSEFKIKIKSFKIENANPVIF